MSGYVPTRRDALVIKVANTFLRLFASYGYREALVRLHIDAVRYRELMACRADAHEYRLEDR